MRRGEDVSLAYFIGTDGRAKGREGASSIDSVAQWNKRLATEWRGEEEGRTWTLLHSREANRRWATLEPTAVAALPNGGGVLLRVVNERGDGLEKNKRLEPTRKRNGGRSWALGLLGSSRACYSTFVSNFSFIFLE